MEEAKKLNVIGKVTIDVVELNKYYQTLDALEDMVRFLPSTNDDRYWRLHSKYFKELDGYGLERNTLPTKKVGNEHWTRTVILQSDITVFISKVSDFLEVITMDVSDISDDVYYVIIPKQETESFIIPKRFAVKENIYETFENVPMSDILLLKGTSNLSEEEKSSLVLIGDRSKNELQTLLESKKQEVVAREEMLKQQIKDIEHKADLMISEAKLKIAEVMRPLVLDIETMTDKLYMFETQIYSTLSFLGMTIDIERLAKGKRADMDEPLYIWQKLRYLDEELPKLVSIFDVGFDDYKVFEKILVENPLIRNFFLPNEKTITVFKTSRKGIRMYYQSKEESSKPGDKYSWTNYILTAQDLAHGHKAALLIRDGENVYIAWTDEDKIYVNDDNLFYTGNTQGVTSVNFDFEEEDDVNRWVEEDRGGVALDNIKTLRSNYAKRRKKTEHPLARLYLKSIIEGLLKRGDILRIPVEENITDAVNNKTRYIRFRAEDLALKENTYGTMDDLLDLSKKTEPRAGEDIYIITREGGKGRGRGDSNRAHDAGLSIGLDKISAVDYYWSFYLRLPVQDHHLVYDEKKGWILNDLGKTIERRTNLRQKSYNKQENKTEWYESYFYKLVDVIVNGTDIRPEIEEDTIAKALKSTSWVRDDGKITLEEYGFKFDINATKVERKVYVSAEKTWSYSGDARANLEIYDSEFINLTHWNSEWLAYAIRNHYTFKRFYGGDFATQLPYLQEMLDFLRNREIEFGRLVFNHYGENLPDKWQVTLSHWMNDHNYRNFSDFRAKQFAKYLKEK